MINLIEEMKSQAIKELKREPGYYWVKIRYIDIAWSIEEDYWAIGEYNIAGKWNIFSEYKPVTDDFFIEIDECRIIKSER